MLDTAFDVPFSRKGVLLPLIPCFDCNFVYLLKASVGYEVRLRRNIRVHHHELLDDCWIFVFVVGSANTVYDQTANALCFLPTIITVKTNID